MTSQDWLARLAAIDTTSRNSNLGLIETVRDDLRARGLDPWLSSNAEGTKANLFCTLPAQDGGTQGGIALSGHTDTVPVDGQNWTSDPFALTERDGRLYARGSCDMKGFIACAVALVPEFLATPRAKPLHLALSYDEEIACIGAPVMLADLQQRGVKVDGAIVGEPTSMQPVVAHKGLNAYRCRVHGKAAHSSLTPQGCNAIEHAAQLICAIREMAEQWRANGPFDQFYDVPYSTITTNLIGGGIAMNTIPQLCEFTYEFRNLPMLSPADIQGRIDAYIQTELLPRMQREFPGAAVEIENLAAAPGLDASEQAAITQLVRALTADKSVRKVAYGTEAGLFQGAGIPTVVCGPGSIEQAHKVDEFVAIDQLAQCEKFLRQVAASL
ncbi:acetylornithine deacetylase [Ottowia oryzae]|uniref:Acetylornithine deacetylase n=1 Tax=Ottowia oryzae TaxID=2109914 RepID=A0A2S0MDE0_9BURK|nr:acetylornithine deacetylase [Ottowia oryzae]AVO33909.1 acetylornithine deacetylase [Ottowia oryzae]